MRIEHPRQIIERLVAALVKGSARRAKVEPAGGSPSCACRSRAMLARSSTRIVSAMAL